MRTMRGNTKLLFLALCGALLASSTHVYFASAADTAAYRGSVVDSVPAAVQRQQPTTAATQAAAARLQQVQVGAAAYRDKPSLKEYYYGKKAEEYIAPGAAYTNPGYSSQYPNPAYQTPATQTPYTAAQQVQQVAAAQPVQTIQAVQPVQTVQTVQTVQQQPVAGTTYYTAPQPQPGYAYPQYPQPAPYPKPYQKPDEYSQMPPPQYSYTYPQQPYSGYSEQPEGYGYAPAPAPYPHKPAYQYPPPAPYYAPAPYSEKDKGYYYPKPAPPMGICQSETFGAFYTQAYDDYITPDNELSGVISAFMGCKDRTTLGGMCSYTCYDGNYFERFLGVTTRIVASPPQDWDAVDPWDHPVYCAWDLGQLSAKSLPPPPTISQTGYNFSCDFTIKAICCDDIVPLVPYGGDVDLGDEGDCIDGDCGDPCLDCDDPATGCGEECEGWGKSAPKGSSKTVSSKQKSAASKKSRSSKRVSVMGSDSTTFTSIGNKKVTGGVRTPKKGAATSIKAQTTAQPSELVATPEQPAAGASSKPPTA